MSITTDQARPSLVPARGLAAALDYAVGSHRRAGVLLLVFSLLAFLPGFFQIPPVDRDEARFAQATKQMVESGEYVDIRFQDEVRYKKPVGIYWLQAAAVKAGEALGVPQARTTHLALSLAVALIGAIGAVLLTYWAALAFVTRRARAARGADDGELGPARRRGAARQDRRDAAAHRRSPRWARWRASICAGRRDARDAGRLDACRRSSGPRSPAACCSRGR